MVCKAYDNEKIMAMQFFFREVFMSCPWVDPLVMLDVIGEG